MMEDSDSSQPSTTDKVILIGVCMVQSFSTSLAGLAAWAVTKVHISLQDSLSTLHLPQEAWIALGEVLGCLLSSMCLCIFGRKTSLQVLVVPLAITTCFLTNIILWSDLEGIEAINSFQPYLLALLFLLQGAGSMSVLIVPLILLLEMVCPRASLSRSRGLAVLYIATVIPKVLANQAFLILHYWISRMVPMVCLGNLFLLVYMPESESWIFYRRHGIHRSFGSNKVFLTMLTCIGLACIPVFLGNSLYEFYKIWSWRIAGGKISVSTSHAMLHLVPPFVTAALFMIRPRTYHRYWLAGGAAICSACLLVSGSILLALEKGNKPPMIIPLILHSIHSITYSAISPLFIFLAAILPPFHRRSSILSASLSTASILLHVAGWTPRHSPWMLIDILHPFGLFWLHAALSILSVIYLIVAVFPQLKIIRTSQELSLNSIDKEETS